MCIIRHIVVIVAVVAVTAVVVARPPSPSLHCVDVVAGGLRCCRCCCCCCCCWLKEGIVLKVVLTWSKAEGHASGFLNVYQQFYKII